MRFLKIQLMTLMMLLMLNDRRRIELTIWVIAQTIAFYGTKGGIFTLLSGGQHYVLGPASTFIAGSNEIAFATIIILPLLWYIWHITERRWLKLALLGAAGLCVLSVLGSQSRGALLALIAMLGMLWLKSTGKFVTGTLGIFALALRSCSCPGVDGAHAKHPELPGGSLGARPDQCLVVRLQPRER